MGTVRPRIWTARTGEPFSVRTATSSDADPVLAVSSSVIAEGLWSVTRPEEFQFTTEQEEAYLLAHAEHPCQLALVATSGAEVVGFLGLEPGARAAQAHVVTLHLLVTRPWRGRRVGTALISTALDWAASHPEIEKVDLAVLADNERAIHVYEKLGFVEEGRRRRAVRRSDGSSVDDVLMGWFPAPTPRATSEPGTQ